jgi:hypothetical protein
MPEETFTCKITVRPVSEWLEGGEVDGNCPPCLIKPLTEMYLGALKDGNDKEHVKTLKKAWKSGDALTIAETLDTIKAEVGDNLRKNLVELDCMAQSHKD